MKFSIIIPAHNAAKFIRKALDSVKIQTYKDYELIVVCDACEDNTADIAREYTDKVIEVDYASEGRTRNDGLDAARGDWILWIDDDDWWMHEYVLETLAEYLTNEDTLSFAFIWKGRGYAPANDHIAVWTRCWRRSWVGITRFPDWWPADYGFYQEVMKKQGVHRRVDILMYYYNFMREGSLTEIHKRKT